jgi:hypothetical protein
MDDVSFFSVSTQRIFLIAFFIAFGSVAVAQPLNQPALFSEEALLPPTESAFRSTPLLTPWGAEVTPNNVHPEYPRPTLVRAEWYNLNGHWDWKDSTEKQDGFVRRILVPFPVESSLSGVVRPSERCIYRRTFTIPPDWAGESNILLHFGAVDWESVVFINGQKIGGHRGGYDPFSFDITPFVHRNEPNELVVHVFDPSQKGEQPRGKQSTTPSGVKYTSSTGIWQTVWLEPVPPQHIQTLQIYADYNTGIVTILPIISGANKDLTVVAEAFDGEEPGEEPVAVAYGGSDGTLMMRFNKQDIKAWSPDSPHMYLLRVWLFQRGVPVDKVGSYFAFRKIEIARDKDGHQVILLNGKRLFQMGVIDQGYWPDGLYTAPTDNARLMDIRVAKSLGFNAIRKYQKIEPERWYYWCDKMGILVWQDMPSGDNRTPAAQQQFRAEVQRMIQSRGHHPSVVAWTIFNEGAGQHNTAEYVDWVRRLDPTRLVNAASGWAETKFGDINASHRFPGPEMPAADINRVAIVGAFGGLTLIPPPEHCWNQNHTWGHQHVSDSDSLVRRYEQMHEELRRQIQTHGLAGAFFHQLTDVEMECNGLTPYSRRTLKVPDIQIEQINRETIKVGSE